MEPKKQKLKKLTAWEKFVAICLIVVGISGIILPILPGWPFIFWGLFLLGGIGLIDQLFLRFLPEKYRGIIKIWLEKFDRNK